MVQGYVVVMSVYFVRPPLKRRRFLEGLPIGHAH